MARILLTGSTGFIGSNLARYWKNKHEIWFILRKTSQKDYRLHDVSVKNIIFWEDIISASSYLADLPEFDSCFHLAVAGNSPSKQEIKEMIDGNISLFIHLIDFCHRSKVKKLIHFSSWAEYGNHGKVELQEDFALQPDYLYGASKSAAYLLGRAYAQKLSLPLITLRLFSLFGPYDKHYNFIPSLIKASLLNKEILLTEGHQVRDFLNLSEVLPLLDLIQEEKKPITDVYNVCSGKGTDLQTIGSMIHRISGKKTNLYKWGARPYRQNEAMYIVGSPQKIQKKFGWKAEADLEKDLQQLFDWYETNLEWLDI